MPSEEGSEIKRIARKLETKEIVELLGERLSGAELNTLMLEAFKERTKRISPAELLKNYRINRFVHPATVDPIRLKEAELAMLRIAIARRFVPVQLSPAAPLGSCSAVGTVDQNKVISATRGTEVVGDATNLMALHICDGIKSRKMSNRDDDIRLCATHRHIRAQYFGDAPGMFPHFHIYGMVTSGIDTGSYEFEKRAVTEHLEVYRDIFGAMYDAKIEVALSGRGGYTDTDGLLERMARHLEHEGFNISIKEPRPDNLYYKGLQFSIKTTINGRDHDIGDGGFVDWSQQMLGNRKERMLISAIGLERLLPQEDQ